MKFQKINKNNNIQKTIIAKINKRIIMIIQIYNLIIMKKNYVLLNKKNNYSNLKNLKYLSSNKKSSNINKK